jgi:hypothetical protein
MLRNVAEALAQCFDKTGDVERASAYRRVRDEMVASLATRPARAMPGATTVPATSPQ